MKILILGGTVFLGRSLVEAALARGHEITLFNRGKANPGLFPDVEEIHGDRKLGLEPLNGRTWDAVIDTSGYLPEVVRLSAQTLAKSVDHYTFISSLSVYASVAKVGLDENGPVAQLQESNPKEVTEVTNNNYGPLKALCEGVVADALPGHTLIIRPGLIVGPYDPSDRFTYWPYRIDEGGEVLAPGRPGRPIQFIDVRDLAEWNIQMVEAGATGIYNATGPEQPLPMGDLLETCREVSRSNALFTWVSEEFLKDKEVGPWMELPLWIPEFDSDSAGFFRLSIAKALQEGLTFRPMNETVRATLDWAKTRPPDYKWRAGISREREAELLESWKQENE